MRASLSELEAVAAVARHGGFLSAARQLGMSSSALSHAIAALEERLAVRLFNRTTRSVVLSAAGEQFLSEIAPALQTIDNAMEHIGEHSSRPSGRLRLNMAPGAARMLLEPLLLEYGRRYPEVELEVVTENALVDVIGKGFDAGVRLAETISPDMVAIPITPTLRSLVVGSPEYFKGRSKPIVPLDLVQHRCIQMRMANGRLYRWEFERRGEAHVIDVPGNLTLDATDLILAAALSGAGLAYIGEYSLAAHMAAGHLIPVLEEWCPAYPGLSLYFSQRRHMPAKLRAFIDLIREQAV
ncbi:DNA-binding transcriptional LysR family regulator [Sinorhizobium meliloti]|uniref:LysR substrate-binding domain-containing protein n=1 Tax=Rhizobium meliloti TaxID=382 RepID=UPI0004F6CD74|nr:LysR substrate-binding domain-containing protein [Sinorhizobium meliloti]AIM01230.1 LysR family transcriptional regulator [Sinorhizobium meliloti]ATA94958.1 LysR family transcriptional regulator [Sinorhizobium meliloti]ATB01625.1 LysR family transcriptional regulator [Sinorhizobium meliloti]MDW9565706.1 LysR family transcriptional regulator [Sinorhizobium meliloti]MDW9583014.1 LysR family transcriptional regulator [Sinorhizobium meliloti]